MRKFVQILSLLLGTIMCMASLAACGSSTANVEPLKSTTVLPGDGIITKEQLETIKDTSGTYTFTGKSGNISYAWSYDAAQIKNPTDQHLKLVLSEKNLDGIKKAANNASVALSMKIEKFDLAGSPKLTLTLPKKWEANHVELVAQQGEALKLVGNSEARIKTTEKETNLSATINVVGRTLYFVGGSTSARGTPESEKGSEDATSGADSDSSSTNQKNAANGKSRGSSGASKLPGATAGSPGSTGSQSQPSGGNSADGSFTVTISIDAKSIVGHLGEVKANKRAFVPANGWIVAPTKIKLSRGQTAYDALVSVTKSRGIHMASRWTPIYGSYYVSGINQLYEFDAGSLSGWMYSIDGWYPNYGSSSYSSLKNGSVIQWRYTKELGKDIGA